MKIIRYSLILLGTFLLAWILPSWYHIVADTSSNNIFTYYSSVERAYCSMGFEDESNKVVRRNLKTGKTFTEYEFDSIIPMFYARQLMNDGRFPDSINGRPITIPEVNSNTFYFRYNPSDISSPSIPIYTLFESFSGRVKLEMPGDVFRLKHKIEFIKPETNKVDAKKSERFMRAFRGAGFKFPAKKAFGNPTTRKMYDEGYFVIDADDRVFHLKMVNGKPFVKNIKVPSGIVPIHIVVKEPKIKSHYGFLLDDQHRFFLITTDNYRLQEIKTPAFDARSNRLVVMANPLYWTVNVISPKGKESLALDAGTKQVIDSVSLLKPIEKDKVLSYVLPFEIRFQSRTSDYVKPDIAFAKIWVLILNLVLAIAYFFLVRKKKNNNTVVHLGWVVLTGVYGFVACLLLKE